MPSEPSLPYRNPAIPIEERVSDLLARMTLEERIAQLSSAWLSEVAEDATREKLVGFSAEKARERIGNGIGQITRPTGSSAMIPTEAAKAANIVQAYLTRETRLGIPAIIHEECLAGFMARKATIFPQIIGLASTWDPGLAEEIGGVIRAQVRAVGARQGLAPVLDVTRDPRWGRVEETYGEDPYLAARMGSAYVRGLQGPDLRQGVAATGKHFAAHGMAEGGLNWAPVHVGEREFREVYLFPFEAAIKEAGLASILNAYHELDGVPCVASTWLLNDLLRGEWGFDGIVVADYNSVVMLADYHRVAADKGQAAHQALAAGLDVELPGTDCYGSPLADGVQAGKVNLALVERAVRRVLSMKFRLGLFEDPFVDPEKAAGAFGQPEQLALARRAARESLVLLKNENDLLPLRPDLASIAVIGPNADSLRSMVGDYTYPSFTDLIEGVETPPENTRFPGRYPDTMITILEAIRRQVSPKTQVRYAPGCDYRGASRDGFAEAVEAARSSDVAMLVVGGKSGLTAGSTCGELRDRADLGLLGVQEELVRAVLETGKPVVLVLVDGRPVAIPALAEKVPAILEAWLPGQEGGQAVAEALFGGINPGGKLPISFPRSASQIPVFYSHKPSGGQSYNFIDYVDQSAKPLFPFGYGLSYTRFEYRDLKISPAQVSPVDEVTIRFVLKNTGDRAGDEVVQLYGRDPIASVTRPVKELKGFQRVRLAAGQERGVSFLLPVAQLAFYDRDMQYSVEPGAIEIMIGSSSEDIRLSGQFEILGEVTPVEKKRFFSTGQVE